MWNGEILPKNYTWYGMGQMVLRNEYLSLYKHVVEYNKITTEENWQSGMHGLFSDGDGETTFRFPLIEDGDVISFSDGATTPVGQKIAEELPNITGKYTLGGVSVHSSNGALFYTYNSHYSGQSGSLGESWVNIILDASRSTNTYKDGGHVKQSGIASRLIIKYK